MKTIRSILTVSTVVLAAGAFSALRADPGSGSNRREYTSPAGGASIVTGSPASTRRADDRREYHSPTTEVQAVTNQAPSRRTDDRREYHSPVRN